MKRAQGHQRPSPLNLGALLLVPAALLLSGSLVGCTSEQSETDTDPFVAEDDLGVATFAGGCFWCVEAAFDDIPGVVSATSGYTGGAELEPTYEQVSRGETGHYESVQVTYDTTRLSYEDMLWVFWRQIDPTDEGGQFVDRGRQYRTAIFVHDETQRRLAQASQDELDRSGRFDGPIVTPILDYDRFWPAEDYHQDYHRTHPESYQRYRSGSGRDQYLDGVWGDEPHGSHAWEQRSEVEYVKPSEEELRAQLTDLQYRVTQESGTEPPFDNELWDNHEEGIYVDIVSGEPLFSSSHKFDSGTGWPSFFTPLVPENIVEVEDSSHGMVRVEVRSRLADSHLGHLFNDGPEPTGLRYCINSAALRFVPAVELEAEGYSSFTDLFGGM